MVKRLWIILVVLTAVTVVSCQSPAVQKSKPKPKAKATVSTKAPAKPKTGAICPKPPPKAKSSKQKPAASKKAPAAKAPAQKKPAKPPAVLPRLVDLGATKCVPCKMMAPILEELAKEYKGKLKVEFIDVWKNRDAGGKYGIRVIPTQIFFDRKGEEFFRHEGFYAKEDILRKFMDQGIERGK